MFSSNLQSLRYGRAEEVAALVAYLAGAAAGFVTACATSAAHAHRALVGQESRNATRSCSHDTRGARPRARGGM